MAKMVLNDWQRGKLPYFSNPEQVMNLKKPEIKETCKDVDPITAKRLHIESKLRLDLQKFEEITKTECSDGEEQECTVPVKVQEFEESDSEQGSDSEEIKHKKNVKIIDSNAFNIADEETELEKLDKQFELLKKKNTAIDNSRVHVVDLVKKR